MSALDEWASSAAEELGLTDPLDLALLLDLARDVAHAIERPAAPITTYLLGLAVARGLDPYDAADRLRALAQQQASGAESQHPIDGG